MSINVKDFAVDIVNACKMALGELGNKYQNGAVSSAAEKLDAMSESLSSVVDCSSRDAAKKEVAIFDALNKWSAQVATGNFQLPRYLFENGYVEVSYDGANFERVGELDCGMFYIEQPSRPIKAVRMVCTSRGNGAEWVSIQPPTIYPML